MTNSTEHTDDELLAALRVGIAAGDFIEVTDEWIAQQAAELNAPVVTVETVDDAWIHRRYYVDGRLVVTVRHGDSKVSASWDVYLAGYNGGPRYCRTPEAAYAAADRHVESARRCSRPVAARLCRLYARHDGPCLPWD